MTKCVRRTVLLGNLFVICSVHGRTTIYGRTRFLGTVSMEFINLATTSLGVINAIETFTSVYNLYFKVPDHSASGHLTSTIQATICLLAAVHSVVVEEVVALDSVAEPGITTVATIITAVLDEAVDAELVQWRGCLTFF